MKRLLAAVAVVLCMATLVACSGKGQPEKKSEGVMTYAEYVAAPLDSEVTIEAYVQAHQSWWDNKITIYAADQEGAYFIYDMPCSEEDSAKLKPGTKIKVKGFKSEWSGEVEITDGTFEIEDGDYIAPAIDVTSLLGKPELEEAMNRFVEFKDLEIVASKDGNGNDADWLYNWDGSGEEGNDVYFNVSKDGQQYTFLVRAYLTGSDTEVYKTAKELKVGDKIDCAGFLYWYEGPNPHITNITIKK